MTFENGVQNMYVLASSTNSSFANLLGQMGGLTTEPGLDLTSNEAKDNALDKLFDLPVVGDTEYSFTLKEDLLKLMQKQGCPGTHSYRLTAVDTKGNSVTKTLNVKIVEIETSEEEE